MAIGRTLRHPVVVAAMIGALGSLGVAYVSLHSNQPSADGRRTGIAKSTPVENTPPRTNPTHTALASPAPLSFTDPTPNERVGKNPAAQGVGVVPEGKRLWIVVKSGQRYYLQGPAEVTPDGWSFNDITLGGDDSADRNLHYEIVAVLADPAADAKLEELANSSHGDTPVQLPQGTETGPEVVVFRNA
jgi:hypothetical protein